MKKLVICILAVLALAACSKNDQATPSAQAGAQPATASSSAASQVVRKATYDPNLKPAEIVWDSPEKKARWEALQAQRAQQAASHPAH